MQLPTPKYTVPMDAQSTDVKSVVLDIVHMDILNGVVASVILVTVHMAVLVNNVESVEPDCVFIPVEVGCVENVALVTAHMVVKRGNAQNAELNNVFTDIHLLNVRRARVFVSLYARYVTHVLTDITNTNALNVRRGDAVMDILSIAVLIVV